MPEWINLSTENERVREMCSELADEIEQITYEPEAVIAKHGKLKSWLKAILAVQTCLDLPWRNDGVIAEKEEAKILSRTQQLIKSKSLEANTQTDKWQSDLARSIF